MRLMRLAIISLSPKPKTPTKPCHFEIGDVRLEISLPDLSDLPENRDFLLVAKASIQIPLPKVEAGAIAIPNEPRELCEQAIQLVSDILSVCSRRRRSVVSATPTVALIPENEEDRTFLQAAKGINLPVCPSFSFFEGPLELTVELLHALNDRHSGLALLAEAYAHTRMSGRYREFVRLFECAFRRSFTSMSKKLAQTLNPAMAYTREEIDTWVSLRHPISHADGNITREIALEADVHHLIPRMEQAALDIFLNKAQWGVWSSDRRAVWKPEAFTNNVIGHGVVRQGSKPTIEFLALDEFKAFPKSLKLNHSKLPENWYSQTLVQEVLPEKMAPPIANS